MLSHLLNMSAPNYTARTHLCPTTANHLRGVHLANIDDNLNIFYLRNDSSTDFDEVDYAIMDKVSASSGLSDSMLLTTDKEYHDFLQRVAILDAWRYILIRIAGVGDFRINIDGPCSGLFQSLANLPNPTGHSNIVIKEILKP